MKKYISIWTYSFVVVVFMAILQIGCKKGDSVTQSDPIKDIDGNVYKTVAIGNQLWMAENLKTTSYNDGTPIENVTDNETWFKLEKGAFCWYANSETNKNIYGGLYNWYAVNTCKLCPTGWHIPTHVELLILTDYLGGNEIAGILGMKLKEKGTEHWIGGDLHARATNISGFTALPGGRRIHTGGFELIKEQAFFWSAEEHGNTLGGIYSITNIGNVFINYSNAKKNGLSVRCLKDILINVP